jgi:hypothetical protein
MSYEAAQNFSASAEDCYKKVVDLLPRQGFEIVRRREIAWLVQARKNVQGRWLNLNIQCRPGAQTRVIFSCQDFGDEETEKTVVDGLGEALRGLMG